MRVEALTPDERPYHRPLLLLGDEQWDMVERYLGRGEMFALRERGETVAIAVVTDEGGGVYEVKNLAVSPERQRHGHGRALLAFLAGWYGGRGSTLRVGTGDAPGTLAFYRRCGFDRSHVVRNFFTDYYDHPIIEEGRRLRDMVYLRKTLTPRAAEGLWAILPYEGRFLRAMARVFHEAVHVGCAGDYTPAQLEAWAPARVDEAAWARRFEKSLTRLAVSAQGEVLGFGNLVGAGYLDCLFVAPEAQGRGIGSALCEALESRAKGDIGVRASLTARPFFERRGYRVIREVRPIRAGLALPAFRMRLTR